MRSRRPRARVVLAVFCLTAITLIAPASASGAIRGLLWTDRYAPTAEIDRWDDIAIGPGHTVFACGTQGLTQGPGWKMIVAKFSQAGVRMWETLLVPGVITWAQPGEDAQGNALAVEHDGNVIVAGWSGSGTGGYAVVKFDGGDGHVLWAQDLRLTDNAYATDVAVDRYNAVYTTGSMTGDATVGHAIVTIKFSAGGIERWRNVYSGPLLDSQASSLRLDASRNTYVSGLTQTTAGGTDWVTMKISPAGERLWTKRWDGPEHKADLLGGLALSSSGALYVAGDTQVGTSGRDDGVVVRYSSSGRRVWTKYLRKSATDTTLMDLCLDTNGNLLLCGVRRPLDASKPLRALLAKMSPEGVRRWLRDTPSPSNPDGVMAYYDMARGPSGSTYLTGAVAPSAMDTDVLIEKRKPTGGLAWRAVFGWPDGGDDDGGRLVVDGTRAVYVASGLWGTTTFIDACLQKYKP